MTRKLVFLSLLVALFAGPAMGADLTKVDEGGALNGAAPAQLPAALEVGNVVAGPATIKTQNGDTLIVRAGALLQVMAPVDGTERFIVTRGAITGDIGDGTEIVTGMGWVKSVKGQRAEFYAEVVAKNRSQVTSNRGNLAIGYDKYTVLLTEGQGIEMWLPNEKIKGDVCFATRKSNKSDVQMMVRLSSALDVRLHVPKATTSCVEQVEGGTKTKISSDPGSWADGRQRIQTFKDDVVAQKGSLGPGAYALIVNATGEITMEAEQVVDFAFIERVTLNTEFQVLAASNFFSK